MVLPAPISATPSTNIVVGRTLSAYFTGSVQNNQETITYTVYNESADSETGVLLTDTLAPGVTLLSASQQPDQSGQNLAWSLGTIQGYDWTSVSITVGVPPSGGNLPVQLDTGAQAYATLDGGAVSNSTPAATLTSGTVDPNLLASTPDANTTDPYVQEEAAALGYNAQNIFNFLHDDIGYNSYVGSLRGARGTLWSSAGNALDVASLGVALLRASGIPAQYVSGTLSTALTKQLILSMFPNSYQTVGYLVPATTTISDPADDSTLQTETESHYWFQFNAGNGWVNADPLIAGAVIGQTFAAPTGTFTEVAQSLRQTTEVQLTAEIWDQASAALVAGSDGLSENVVFDQTFNDVDLVGRPLTLGFNTAINSTGFTYTTTTNTYVPYLAWGDDAYNSTRDRVILGGSFQEVYSSFPLGNSVLTGIFLNITQSGAGVTAQTFSRTLLDRIGYAARQGFGNMQVSIPVGGEPAFSSFDAYTLDVTAAAPDPHPTAELNQELQSDASQVAALQDTSADAQIAETYATDYSVDLTRSAGKQLPDDVGFAN